MKKFILTIKSLRDAEISNQVICEDYKVDNGVVTHKVLRLLSSIDYNDDKKLTFNFQIVVNGIVKTKIDELPKAILQFNRY